MEEAVFPNRFRIEAIPEHITPEKLPVAAAFFITPKVIGTTKLNINELEHLSKIFPDEYDNYQGELENILKN